jgi:hypothetical protein
MPYVDAAVYGSTLAALLSVSMIYWRLAGVGLNFILRCLLLVLLIVLPMTLLGVATGIVPLALAFVVLSEEGVRWTIVKDRPAGLKRRHVALSVGMLFGLVETTNWIFVDKARTALANAEVPPGGLVAADVAYITAEYGAGVIVHGGLTALLMLIQGSGGSRKRLVIGVVATTALHFLLNLSIVSGVRGS